ncbi:MAG: DUF4880 domain-containing protein [Hyphomonadaceae bacterium]|nr:DUF4880 domain-containing protein [Hyphomonadaceae bacterium]
MRAFVLAFALLLSACTASVPSGRAEFERWLAADPDRPAVFARFEALLTREGVAEVVPARELWLTDRMAPECVVEPFVMPPEELWPRIVPTLRYIRDHVVPAIGAVTVASGYRDPAFNTCVNGASQSAHRGFHALDLLPRDPLVTRERLIQTLCPIHAREGPRLRIGMGIYRARRFHIDASRFRGWGEDFSGATFPCRGAID